MIIMITIGDITTYVDIKQLVQKDAKQKVDPWRIHVLHRGCYSYHYDDVIMGAIASQITSLTIVYSTVYSGADQSKHQSSASLAFVWGIHRGPVNSPHKWPVTPKMFPFDDVIMSWFCTRICGITRCRQGMAGIYFLSQIQPTCFTP